MTRIQPVNIEASVKAKLQNYARDRHIELQRVFTMYAAERFLFRLSQSPSREAFVLKGATLFLLWLGQSHRPTRDLDFLGVAMHSEEEMREIIRGIIETPVEPDGLMFALAEMSVAPIREEDRYGGLRIKLTALLGKSRIPVQIDIGFGDTVVPQEARLNPILDLPPPVLKIYPRESLIAEKFEAMVSLGALNSRLKDYYDIYFLLSHFDFEGGALSAAVKATFARRKTAVPNTLPVAFTPEFFAQPAKQTQWQAFLRNAGQSGPIPLEAVVSEVADFLMPVANAVLSSEAFDRSWNSVQQTWLDHEFAV